MALVAFSADERKMVQNVFATFSRDGSELIDHWELRLALEAMGQVPTDSDVKSIMSQLSDESKQPAKIDFNGFLHAIEMQKMIESKVDKETDFVDAFVSMGGNPDRSGSISIDLLRRVVRDDFGMSLNIDELIADILDRATASATPAAGSPGKSGDNKDSKEKDKGDSGKGEGSEIKAITHLTFDEFRAIFS